MHPQKAWSYRVNAIMKRDYAITLEDAGLSHDDLRNHFRNEPEAAVFVEWFASKHDLDHVSSLGVSLMPHLSTSYDPRRKKL